MENQDRIAELLAESLKGQDIVTELKETNQGLNRLEKKTDKIEEQLIKLNLQTVEKSRAILKPAGKIDHNADLHNRVSN